MGHREDLLTAARQCLEDKGYARTTARDLVAASGTNLWLTPTSILDGRYARFGLQLNF